MKFISLVISFGYLALLEAVSIPSSEDDISLVCKSQGRFEDLDDCGSFVECTETRKGRMLAKKRSCHGKAFDPETRTCRDPSQVKGCTIRGARYFSSSMRFNMLCANETVKYACGDCGTQITCSGGKAFETKCEGELRCVTESEYFDGAVCHTEFDDKCKCLEPNSYRQDPYYNGTFFLCTNEGSVPSFYHCPPLMYFDEETETCLNKDGTPACTGAGIFPYPDDCSKYYVCTYTVERWLQKTHTCAPGTLFNEDTKQCEDPCEWGEKEFVCEEQGRFKNPKDCGQFYECISRGDSFLTITRMCPPRLYWSDEERACVPEYQSKCTVKPNGPIKKCYKNYINICKLGVIDETGIPEEGGEEETGTPENGEEEETGTPEEGEGEETETPEGIGEEETETPVEEEEIETETPEEEEETPSTTLPEESVTDNPETGEIISGASVIVGNSPDEENALFSIPPKRQSSRNRSFQ